MSKLLSYEDIALIPEKSIVKSRSECRTAVEFCGYYFKAPIIPANMECSINFQLAEKLVDEGYFYIMHRFVEYPKLLKWIEQMAHKHKIISFSVGVKDHDKELLKSVWEKGIKIDFVTIDIAHGHSILMEEMIQFIRENDKYVNIIAGNVTTAEAVEDLSEWGAHVVKVGIGQGHVCTTRLKTGFGSPMFSAVLECANASNMPIIADGGIKHYGDIAKALVAGATMTMAGSLFARCNDSPAEIINNHGKLFKYWYGSASGLSTNNSLKKYIEGTATMELANNLSYSQLLGEIEQSLKSSISYAGGKTINIFDTVNWELV